MGTARLLVPLLVAAAATLSMPAVSLAACSPDSGFEWCHDYSAYGCYAKIQVDTDYNTAWVNGYLVAAKDYLMRFRCPGTIYLGGGNNVCGTCGWGGCAGSNIGSGEATASVGSAYNDNAQMNGVACFVRSGSSCWSCAGYNPWSSGVKVVHCYDDSHCGCGQRCEVSGAPSNWKCVAKTETCNNVDDDCDGTTDEGYPDKGSACSAGVGECLRTGRKVCNAAGNGTVCDAVAGNPTTETCDNRDNDCDGLTDETLGSTTCGTGECQRTVQNCVGGVPQACVPGVPVAETCDGRDNDCNGTPDNGFNVGQACTVGVGECVNTGVWQCSGPNSTACSVAPRPPAQEACDGRDNDCDGVTDDGFPLKGTACVNGVGDCVRSGVYVCAPGGAGVACDAVPGQPAAEACDGRDNDCDGVADDGFPLKGTSCVNGVGECARDGTHVCNGAGTGVVCDAVPGLPVAEACDGDDDDCNGVADNGFPVGGACDVGVGECRNAGHWRCTGDGTGVECDVRPGTPSAELCDGLDNDCDGVSDEDFPAKGQPCANGLGECRRGGKLVCDEPRTGLTCDAVPGIAAAETCNGLDDDCNGVTDDGWPLGQPCSVGTGDCNSAGSYVCAAGGTTVECDAIPLSPQDEVCDGRDNDCDGVTDDGFPLKGTPCASGLGECRRGGTYVCNALGNGVACDAVPGAGRPETCDGKDNDCDGTADDPFPLGQACTVGIGECVSLGVRVCTADGSGTTCGATPGTPGPEVCDGKDNDCDGVPDDPFPLGQACSVGVGECVAAGSLVCKADRTGVICDAVPKPPGQETCNGKDDDCDGTADDDFPLGEPCRVGVGECEATGVMVCSEDHATARCSAVPRPASPERCDGKDNDCDAIADEDYPLGEACHLGVGECSRGGKLVCSADGVGTACDAVPGEPAPERCNGLDDDCDGKTDNGFLIGEACVNGVGACARSGALVCAPGGLGTACDAVPGEPVAEECNGVDEDCDGVVDDDFPVGEACEVGLGLCRVTGVLRCTADGSATECDALPGDPLVDVCNGVDDDCDGVVDGAFDVGEPCTNGTGACERTGFRVCREDQSGTVCDAVPGEPGVETCNAVDDDCDGVTDNGYDLAEPCSVGRGACVAAGEPRCALDGLSVECVGEPGEPGVELCNGVDDDCDGATDEGYVTGEPCETGVGACRATGAVVCTADGTGLECGAREGDPGPERCNGLDDDCDGSTDEDFVLGGPCTVGVGTCEASGTVVCEPGEMGTRCDAEPGEPGVIEACDGLDNDCDGETDDGYDVGAPCTSGTGACLAEGIWACNLAGNGTECTAVAREPGDEACNGVDDDCDGETDEDDACGAEPAPGEAMPADEAADAAVDGAGDLQAEGAGPAPDATPEAGADDGRDAVRPDAGEGGLPGDQGAEAVADAAGTGTDVAGARGVKGGGCGASSAMPPAIAPSVLALLPLCWPRGGSRRRQGTSGHASHVPKP